LFVIVWNAYFYISVEIFVSRFGENEFGIFGL